MTQRTLALLFIVIDCQAEYLVVAQSKVKVILIIILVDQGHIHASELDIVPETVELGVEGIHFMRLLVL